MATQLASSLAWSYGATSREASSWRLPCVEDHKRPELSSLGGHLNTSFHNFTYVLAAIVVRFYGCTQSLFDWVRHHGRSPNPGEGARLPYRGLHTGVCLATCGWTGQPQL